MPSRWARARVAQFLFNRIVEDVLDMSKMQNEGRSLEVLAFESGEYEMAL